MDQRPSARADLISALVWLVLGGAIVYASWTMDRLESQNINPLTAPGLVPGLLGASLIIMALLLLRRAVRAGGHRLAMPGRLSGPMLQHVVRVSLTLALCFGFALGLVGRGLPFWLSSALFVAVFIFLFQYPARRGEGTLARGAVLALVCGVATGVAVTGVFQEIFLVRLP